MVSSFAESSEMALQRERAWNFFREECLCGIEPAPESMQSFLDWFILEYPLEEGDTVLSLFMKDNCRYLSCAQLEVLKRWSDASISFYRIREVRPGRGLLVEDIFCGSIAEILNKNVSLGIQPNFLIMTRLIPVGNSYDYSGALFVIPPSYEEDIKKTLSREIRSCSKSKKAPPFGDPLWKAFLSRRGHFFLSYLHSILRASSEAKESLRKENSSIIIVTVFHLDNCREAIHRLQEAPFLQLVHEKKTLKNQNTYTWEWYEKVENQEEHTGNLLLLEDRLLLHSFQQENLSKGKEKISSCLEGFIAYQEDKILELSEEDLHTETLSLETNYVLQENLQHFYSRAWIHSPLQEFKGKTPFQLRKKKDGINILEDVLLKLEEKQSEDGGESSVKLDTSLLREKLLLRKGVVRWRARHWDWEKPVYKEIALLMEDIAEPMELTPQQLAGAFRLWNDYIVQEKPVIRKPQAWAGALAYLISSLDHEGFSQKEIAGFFAISGGSISVICRRIRRSLDLEYKADCYRTRKNLD